MRCSCPCFKKCCCLCWFVIAAVLAVLVITIQSAQLGITGGPYPTQITADGSIVLLFSNSCTVISFICAVIFLVKDCKNIVGYAIILFFLVLVVVCSLFIPVAIYAQSEVNVKDVQEYTIKYSKKHNGAAPPFLEFIQKKLPCCGGCGFHDYVHPPPKKVGDTFSLPDTCCEKETPGCGKNLSYLEFDTSYWVHDRIRELSSDFIKEAEDPGHLFNKVKEASANLIYHRTNETFQEMIDLKLIPTHPDDPITVPNNKKPYLPIGIIEHLKMYIKNAINKTHPFYTSTGRRDPLDIENTINANKELDLKELVEKQRPKIKIYGCAILLNLTFEAKFIPKEIKQVFEGVIYGLVSLVCFQAVLNFICLGIYNYYYWKIIRNGLRNAKVLPMEGETQSGPGNTEGERDAAGIAADEMTLSTDDGMTPQPNEVHKKKRRRSSVKLTPSTNDMTPSKEVEKVKPKRSSALKKIEPTDDMTPAVKMTEPTDDMTPKKKVSKLRRSTNKEP